MKAYKIISITDEQTECGCCGKTNLKKTVVMQDIVNGEYYFFGSTCAAKAANWTAKEFKAESEKAYKAQYNALTEEVFSMPRLKRGTPERNQAIELLSKKYPMLASYIPTYI